MYHTFASQFGIERMCHLTQKPSDSHLKMLSTEKLLAPFYQIFSLWHRSKIVLQMDILRTFLGRLPRSELRRPVICRCFGVLCLCLAVQCSTVLPAELGSVDDIDPMTGTITKRTPDDFYGLGKTFPGATAPFGMVQLSPDTITGGDNASGYNYLHDSIEGFSLCHLSGTGWYGELGNFQVMPTVGPLVIDRERARSKFNHENESAKVGYYSVLLDRYNGSG